MKNQDRPEHVEKALRESEERFRLLYERLPLPYQSLDENGWMIEVNPAWLAAFGYSRSEVIGRWFGDFLTPEYAERFRDRFPRFKAVRETHAVQFEFVHKDGARIFVEFDSRIEYDVEGRFKQTHCVLRDITERKQVENLTLAQRDLAIALNSVRGLDEGLRRCLETALKVSGIDSGGIYLSDDTSGALDLVCHQGLPRSFVRHTSHYASDSANVKLVSAGKPIYAKHQELGISLNEVKSGEKLCAIGVLPISHENRVIGCLNVASHSLDEVPEFSRVPLETIAAQIGSAIARLKAKEALRIEIGRTEKYFNLAGTMLIVLDSGGIVTRINRKGCEILNRAPDDIIGKNWFETFIPKRVRAQVKTIFNQVMAGNLEPVEYYENAVLRDDGEEKIIAWHNTVLKDDEGHIIDALSSGEDITERRRANEELLIYQQQLRALASELSLAEERERRQIASDLHDSASQTLALAKMKLVSAQNSAREDELAKTLNEISEMIDQALTQTRSLTFELSPPVLYRMGLEPALAGLARQMEEKHGLNVALDMNTEPTPLPGDLRVTLFRAIQELLINVVKHAHTRKAHVNLRRKEGQIVVEVADRGRGYMPTDVSHPSEKSGGFGLFSIRERLNYLGGSLDIQAQVGGGTRVILTAPLPVEQIARESES